MNKISLQKNWLAVAVLASVAVTLLFVSGISRAQAAASPTLFGDAAVVSSGGNPDAYLQANSSETPPGYGGASFSLPSGTVVNDISILSTDFKVIAGNCGGGAPRFSISVPQGNIFVYLGPTPNFNSCSTSWTSTGNLLSDADLRVDTSQIPGGTYYDTWAHAKTLVGSSVISDLSLVVDASWAENGNQSIGFDNTNINGTTYDYTPAPVTVTIDKYVDGSQATPTSANSSSFPMSSTWSATNIGSGTGTYALGPTGFNSPNAYEAVTSEMTSGASYTTNEVTGGSVVGADCAAGKPYALKGYTYGDTREAAQNTENMSSTPPNFENITSNKYVIVWNVECLPAPVNVSPADGSTLTSAQWTSADWSDVADESEAMTYYYESSLASTTNPDGSFTSPVYQSGALATSSIPTTGTPEGTYYWHARGKDSDGNYSAWSAPTKVVVNNTPPPPPYSVKVVIMKRLNGQQATAQSASSSVFTMNASWNDPQGIGSGSGTYPLDATENPAYQTQTINFHPGSNYGTSEVMGGNVGANCAAGKPYALDGYSTGNTAQEAASSTATTTSPSFTNLQGDKYVVVWNKTCPNGSLGGDVTGSQGILAVNSITSNKTNATADNTYENGWIYTFHLTIPTGEPNVAMKFSDWVSASGTIPVANNMRISSPQANNGGATITLTAANTYSTPDLHMITDLDPSTPGIQADVKVEVKIPVGTPNASYTTSYGVKSE